MQDNLSSTTRAPLWGAADRPFTGDIDDQPDDDATDSDTVSQLRKWAECPNLAADDDCGIPADKLAAIGHRAVEEYRLDRESRAEWEEMAKHAVECIPQKPVPKSYPWENAANVRNPNTTIACLRFAAMAYPAVVDGDKIVKCGSFGRDDDQESAFRADRVASFMSWQLMHQMPEWQDDKRVLLHQLPAIGCVFTKVYPGRKGKRQRHHAEMVSAFDLVVHNNTTSLESCPRISQRFELYPHEIQTKSRSGEFIKLQPGELTAGVQQDDNPNPGRILVEPGRDEQAPQEFIEQHRWEDLDNDGYAEPWIVTVHLGSSRVVRLQANYDLDAADIDDDGTIVELPRYDYFVKYGFIPDPRGGYYDLGYYEIARSVSEALDTTINQSLDASHLQNAGGGFIGSGLNLKKTQMRFQPGIYHTVNAPGAAIKDAIVHNEYPGASQTGMVLLEKLDQWMGKLVSTEGVVPEQGAGNVPAATTLARIEQALKVYEGVYKGIYRSLSKEYELLAKLNFRFPNDGLYRKILNWKPSVAAGSALAIAGGQPSGSANLAGPQSGGLLSPPPAGVAPFPQQGGAAPSGLIPGAGAPGTLAPGMAGPPVLPSGALGPLPMMQPPSMLVDFAPDEISHVTPTADPSASTDIQALIRAQFLMELAAHPTLGPLLPKLDAIKQILMAAKATDLIAKVQAPDQSGMQVQQQLAAAKAADLQAGATKKQAEAALAGARIHDIQSGIVKTGFDMKMGAAGAHNDALTAAHTAAVTAKDVEQSRAEADHNQRMDIARHGLEVAKHAHSGALDLMQHGQDALQAHHQRGVDVANLHQQQQQLDQAARQAQQQPQGAAQDGT